MRCIVAIANPVALEILRILVEGSASIKASTSSSSNHGLPICCTSPVCDRESVHDPDNVHDTLLQQGERSHHIIHKLYAPTSSAPDDEIERFYNDISQALTIETAHYKYIIGDFDAKLGVPAGKGNQYVGKFGLGCTNERGERLINYLQKETELNKKLSNKEALNSLNINDLENRISTDIRTTAKKICATTKKNNSKIKKETRELMAKRRNLDKGTHEYNKINRLIKKKTKEDLRQYNTEMITTTIENNKNMKVLKTRNNDGRLQIHQLRDANRNIKEDSKNLMDIVENFYSALYTGDNPEQVIGVDETILNVGSEDLRDITGEEVELALSQMKNGKAPGEDGITAKMIKLGGRTTVEASTIFLNKCMTEGPAKLDAYQPPEQAGFRKGHSTIEHIQSVRTIIEKCNEYNEPLHLAFIDYNKAFDSVELSAIFKAMNNARIDSRYKQLLKHIYENATITVKISEEIETNKIQIKRGGTGTLEREMHQNRRLTSEPFTLCG
ncbi:uncharacterized protein LOC126743295 [Anthonomus grandis grandis]|uniref:uncharacterized protein LOC126743295 n=1 Tax=Anthonomus grandis grandis TaxID=2921223 RepID=UPI002165CC65|nr:uncharacterized protein LOC126743295 [Anthonomus grandis grandis]